MTTTQTRNLDGDARIAINRLARAQRLVEALRRRYPATLAQLTAEAAGSLVADHPQSLRDELASSIGMSSPSEVTWAMVVALVETGWGKLS